MIHILNFRIITKPQYLKNRYNLNRQKIIYTLSRLSTHELYKGYDRVLQALPELKKKIPGIMYIIAGKADAKERGRIEQLIQSLNVKDNVMLAGFIKDEEIIDHYLLADTFIMPSTQEGFGIVFIEAMTCGLRVIAGNADGSVDALKNGMLGKLINPLNNDEIIDAVVTAESDIKHNGKLQQEVIKHFGFDKFKQKLSSLLTDYEHLN